PQPSCSLVPAGDGDALVVRTATPSLERFELATGRLRWRTALPGRYSTAPPLVTGDGIVLVTGDGIGVWLDPGTGEITGDYQLTGLREGHGPYRAAGPGAPTAPVPAGRDPVVVLLDGSAWRLRPGGPEPAGDAGAPVTTQPAVLGPDTLAVLTTGAVLCFLDLGGQGEGQR
ncbi:MAG: PQQ-like beta-propeller repeat protein, partial [Nocardiopsaceae bacterium]|nr:PQQ-like beta-propeller repeat protein [Nocardiopsaceae bacterium]